MGVDQRVARWLGSRGHDVVHLRDEGLHRMPDEHVFAKAIAEKRLVLTFDLDFGEIAALTQGKVASVVLFRLHNTRAAHVIERLEAVLATAADALDAGAVVIVEESRHRVRPLPIGRSLPGV